jgi:hypothetical protein
MHSEIRKLDLYSDRELLVLDVGAEYADKVSFFITREQAHALKRVLEGVDQL